MLSSIELFILIMHAPKDTEGVSILDPGFQTSHSNFISGVTG